ncbi:MAG: heparinase II/III family protein [Planctomycetota bacterium]|nr:heparinase II/III family protein [Planctomycetota bacterium]
MCRIILSALAILPLSLHTEEPEWAAFLPDTAEGFGPTISQREAWDELAGNPDWSKLIGQAESLKATPVPDQPDELYLEFSKTGNRSRWQRVAGQRRSRVRVLTLAECLENKGRFIQPLEEIIQVLCSERTWVMPAHDRGLRNFNGKEIDIDLASSALGWELATVKHLLGDKLNAEIQKLILENVRRRVLDPFIEMADGKRKENWWTRGTNNWNAVCLAGVTGAAITLADSREERVRVIQSAMAYSQNFLKGFTSDGYCSEGMGYWNYGFGHYILLSEAIYRATKGRIDLQARENAIQPALFASRIEIMNGIYPSFADCSVSSKPNIRYMQFLSQRFGLGLEKYESLDTNSPTGSLFEIMLLTFPEDGSRNPKKGLHTRAQPAQGTIDLGENARAYFKEAGVLVCRPNDSGGLAVALKGGHNDEHHNHNDVGTFIVVSGQRALLVDPGSEVYTARTFSGRRYDSKVLNSYGHPVPLIAGKLQRKGRAAAARVLKAEFTPEQDTFILDLKAAYDVKTIERLERTFTYSRLESTSLRVTDTVELSEPATFETALIIFGGWRQTSDTSLLIYEADVAVKVEIETSGPFEVLPEVIREDITAPSLPLRLGLRFKQSVQKAEISLTITPASPMQSPDGELLQNGGFESGNWAWSVRKDSMSSISDVQAADGKYSLKISDNEDQNGSNVSSSFVPIAHGQRYKFEGEIFHESGSGVGLYVKYYSKDQKLLNEQTNPQGHIAAIGTPDAKLNEWLPFSYPFSPPEGTAYIQVWIHSYNAAKVTAFLDKLSIRKVE